MLYVSCGLLLITSGVSLVFGIIIQQFPRNFSNKFSESKISPRVSPRIFFSKCTTFYRIFLKIPLKFTNKDLGGAYLKISPIFLPIFLHELFTRNLIIYPRRHSEKNSWNPKRAPKKSALKERPESREIFQ